MNATPIYADYLKASLIRAGMNEGQVQAIMRKFDLLADKNPGLAFVTMHSAYANEDTDAACLTVKAIIQHELGKLAGQPGPERNPIRRLKAAVEKFNAKLSKCSCLLDGKEALSEQELESAKLRLAACLTPGEKSEALASVVNLRKKIQRLEVELKQ